jgi:hypothetical protein
MPEPKYLPAKKTGPNGWEMSMSGKTMIAFAALLCGMGCQFAVAAADQPNPPAQICVNDKCSAVAAPASPAAATGTRSIKWNPGHYMASYSVLFGGNTMSKITAELDDLNNRDAILGYRLYISWSALEPTKGNYDFSQIDAILQRLKTAYNKPKRLVVYLWLYYQGKMGTNDARIVPLYIQTDPAYGPSPVAGGNGWWGKNSNGASTGQYAPALYYQPVMDRLIALVQALGKHLDSDPNVEALAIMENATIAQSASGLGSVDPHYSDAEWQNQLQRLLTAATAAFPHTSVVMDNSYFDRSKYGIALTQWMAANRIAQGAPDSWGQTALSAYGISNQNDGLQTYLGGADHGGVDLRQKMAAMIAVESPEIATNYFRKWGGPWTPLDIVNALNQTYYATHAFWTRMTDSTVPDAALWKNVAAVCAANPLIHTDYPANYP